MLRFKTVMRAVDGMYTTAGPPEEGLLRARNRSVPSSVDESEYTLTDGQAQMADSNGAFLGGMIAGAL